MVHHVDSWRQTEEMEVVEVKSLVLCFCVGGKWGVRGETRRRRRRSRELLGRRWERMSIFSALLIVNDLMKSSVLTGVPSTTRSLWVTEVNKHVSMVLLSFKCKMMYFV